MDIERVLDTAGVRRYYDRFGAHQDSQAFYEDPALDELVAAADFGSAHQVYELGCGTGRLAERLLAERLPPDARYLGVDVSTTMVALTRQRLARFGARTQVRLSEGDIRMEVEDGGVDRVVSAYVLDLLPVAAMRQVAAEAKRVLAPGGRVCLVSLTRGVSVASRAVAAAWGLAFRLSPRVVGGCRPIELLDCVGEPDWRLLHHRIVVAWGVPSEVVVAERR